MNSTLKRFALPVGAAVVLGTSGFAFMATNAVPVTQAGDGNSAISGYNVSNVSYDTDNGRIIAVRFDLDGVAKSQNVEARIGSGVYDLGRTNSANDDGCQLTSSTASSTSWLCIQNPRNVTATLADAQNLRVFAAQ